MKILVDENIPAMTLKALRELGHDVRDFRGTDLEGADDEVLWDIAQKESRLLITTDMGFAQHHEKTHHGILIVRLRQPNRQKIHDRVLKAIKQTKKWSGLRVVMQDTVKRVWKAR